jgi:predicted DNA-binding protein (MmcQ/YjbR family)
MQNLESIREYILAKAEVTEGQPFGPDVVVLRVAGKIFAIFPLDPIPARVNLKCDPERAIELREQFEAVQPGYHMNKQHWNTVLLDGSLPDELVCDLIDHSYKLVVQSLPKSKRVGFTT